MIITTRYCTLTVLGETTEDEPIYVAVHPELGACFGQGDTPEEARADLALAAELHVSVMRENGLEIPPPLDFNKGICVIDYQEMTVKVVPYDY